MVDAIHTDDRHKVCNEKCMMAFLLGRLEHTRAHRGWGEGGVEVEREDRHTREEGGEGCVEGWERRGTKVEQEKWRGRSF